MSAEDPTALSSTQIRPPRLIALDAWRGLTVMLMLLVNNVALGNLTPQQLTHAEFGGVTLTDLVFPWFLFCAGAALPFSHAAAQRAGVSGSERLKRLLARSALLYLLGAFVTSVAERRFTLGLGVLQLIALATLLGSLMAGWRAWAQGAVAAALLVGYALFLTFGSHAGGVGVISETAHPLQPVNAWLTPLGLRGLPSVVPTTALILLGSLAARPLQQRSPRLMPLLLGLGVGLTALGYGWALSDQLPFSKTLWTPPYILYTAGLGTLGLLGMYLLADWGRMPFGSKMLSPLTIPGRNALAAYVLPILIKVWILQEWVVTWTGPNTTLQQALLKLAQGSFGPWWGGWTYTLGYLLSVWLGLAWMAWRGLIWKL